jgi:hypothetical protein
MTSTIKVNNIQNQCGQNIINENSNTITIGASGDTIALASGASQTGFGREGSVDWQTNSIKTATFTATSGEGYFCNTSGGVFTVNLPAGSAGAIVSVADYTRTFDSNNLTISPNGSEKIGGVAEDALLSTIGQSATFVYVDATEGWINVQETSNSVTGTPPNLVATGGTITTCGNCKIHTFTGPGTFQVTNLSSTPANNQVSYMVVAGGAGGAWDRGGGGGAGGFREDKSPITPYTASPLEGAGTINATITSFPITVGAGGAGGNDSSNPVKPGQAGSPSTFSTITSAGGGGGGAASPATDGVAGGSGGGASGPGCGGAGNVPPVSPSQGFPGGNTPGTKHGSGGGGATAAGTTGNGPLNPGTTAAKGGAGATTSINGSAVTYAGGGGGGFSDGGSGCNPFPGGAGGAGGGGTGGSYPGGQGSPATANTGGGGGGGSNGPNTSPAANGGAGGSGIVVIRYKFQ